MIASVHNDTNKNNKVVIFGAKGMLGSDLRKVFNDLSPYIIDKEELDITNQEVVHYFINKLKPALVINAAAYTDVDGCEANRELAMKVNGEAPRYLAEASKKVEAVFVHYSTDYVFDGARDTGYSEEDRPSNPVNFYGESKLVGENAIKNAGGNYYIVRTSWLFGLGGLKVEGRPRNFIEKVLRLSKEKDEIKVVNDQHGKPTFTLDLAKKTRELIAGHYRSGIYHIVNEPATTWYDFAREIFSSLVSTHTVIVNPCGSEEFPRPAKRPQYSVLINSKLPPMRGWREALGEYLRQR